MYKRLAAIAVLMGLPVFMQPSSTADTDTPVDVSVGGLTVVNADAVTTTGSGSSSTPTSAPNTNVAPTTTTVAAASTSAVATAAPATAAPTSTVAPTTTAAPPTTLPTTTAVATTTTLPPTTATPTTPAPLDYQARGQAALAGISYNWQAKLPGWTVTFSPGREGVIGYTYTNEHRIEIFVRDSISDSLLRHVIAHELGHAVDVSLNTSSDRERWQAARGIGGSPWWPGNGVSDYSTGAGDFAESFAAWQVGGGNFRSKLGGVPTGDQIALLAELAG